MKTGLWGGNGGSPCDTKVEPHRLETFTVCSGAVIDSLAFSFRDKNQHQHTAGPWGGNGGRSQTVSVNMNKLKKSSFDESQNTFECLPFRIFTNIAD